MSRIKARMVRGRGIRLRPEMGISMSWRGGVAATPAAHYDRALSVISY